MIISTGRVLLLAMFLCAATAVQSAPMKALILDGQNNHDWKRTTPELRKILEESGMFTVDVATSPAPGGDMNSFKPDFAAYRVIVSNYNGEPWSKETQAAFERHVREGGGFVPVHAADNAFPEWKEYNEMIAVGGWGERTEKHGPYLRLRDGKWVQDTSPGRGGSHGAQHEFVVETRELDHPIMRGLPAKWLHGKDELYDRLRGPARNVTVLASALATKETRGSGEHEPLLMTISYGKGRIFHTALGHGTEAIKCVGFAVTLQRGAEWAATGQVTQKVPDNFPTENKVQSWP